MKTALVLSVVLALYEPSVAESIAFSIHAGKIEGKEFNKDDLVVGLVAESIVGPSVFEISAMIAGSPVVSSSDQTIFKSVSTASRIIIGYDFCRLSAGVGGGIVDKESTTISPQGYHEEHRQRGIQLLGVGELRIAIEKGTYISGRLTQLRTRFLGVKQGWRSSRLYTVGFIVGFGS